jgi:DNA-binding transcriptional regulator LsrR (DeoR family)
MGRLNVYVPEEMTAIIERWRERVNLSELCVSALRDSLEALETGRAVGPLLQQVLGGPSLTEQELASRFGLRRAIVALQNQQFGDVREAIAVSASDFLQHMLVDGVTLALGGGRQMWSVVRRMTARSNRVNLAAIGIGQVDPKVLHAHPNTLVTLLWLLFSPRATAELVGSSAFHALLSTASTSTNDLQRIIVGSCSAFDPASPYAHLLGDAAGQLANASAAGDFLGVFLDADSHPVYHDHRPNSSLLDFQNLRAQSERSDTIVALVAGGPDKREIVRLTLGAGLCNTLITDHSLARALLD